MIERREERQRQRDMSTTAGRGQQTTRTNGDASMTATKASWSSTGSSKNRIDAWLGGVTMAAVGEAAKRQQQEVVDFRKWGRYLGRIYRGKNKKTLPLLLPPMLPLPPSRRAAAPKVAAAPVVCGIDRRQHLPMSAATKKNPKPPISNSLI